ncbi:secreted effector protein pipB2 [mine drainage metagenome]|uniref:Secreted effector protein pipB2 n=1 Tax=mine drainage metagenome TaxID=410659 RepID=A0A1J5S4T5_9ZZZZ
MKIFQIMIAAMLFCLTGSAVADEFNGQCAMGLASGMMVQTKCEVNAMFEGKRYCFSSQESKTKFLENPKAMATKAAEFYAKNAEIVREKISQQDALSQIHSKTCDLSNKDAGYLELDGLDLRHCNMTNTSFFGAYLRGANLSGANMERAYLNLARLENADLSHANLKDATIFQAIFDKTSFKGANLTNARMIGTLGNVDMSDANISHGRFGLDIGNQPMGAMRFDAIGGNFANSNFEGADINRTNVRFANFRNANLRNTNLFRADFSKADLTGADITGANLNEAILDGTIMTGVKGLAAIKGYDVSKGECVDCKVSQ